MKISEKRFRELRQTPRTSLKQTARYCISGDGRVKYGIIENISKGGICLHTSDRIRKGTLLSIEFKLPGKNISIIATTRSVWSHQDDSLSLYAHSCGLCFDKIPPSSQEEINAFIDRNLEREEKIENSRKPVILAVDDDKDILELLATLLRDKYDVHTARDGHEAIQSVHDNSPDLIFLDVKLPYLDGWQVLMLLKNNPETKSIPVIMMSCVTDRKNIITAAREGAIGYMAKPFAPELIIKKITEILPPKNSVLEEPGESLGTA